MIKHTIKVYLFIFLIVTFLSQTCSLIHAASYDILHYNIDCEIFPKEKRFHAITNVRIKNGNENLEKLSLNISDYKVLHVKMSMQELDFSVESGRIDVKFKEPLP